MEHGVSEKSRCPADNRIGHCQGGHCCAGNSSGWQGLTWASRGRLSKKVIPAGYMGIKPGGGHCTWQEGAWCMRNSENEKWLQHGEPGRQSEGGGLGWAGAGEAEPPGMGKDSRIPSRAPRASPGVEAVRAGLQASSGQSSCGHQPCLAMGWTQKQSC